MNKQNSFSHEPLSGKVYIWLRQEILAGRLAQGERLNELNIAGQLGVSVTPVREAIRLLKGDGLVQYNGWKGARVIELTDKEIRHCFSVREVLEQLALREAMPLLTAADKDQLMTLAQETANAEGQPAEALFEIDRAFHSFLVNKAGNRWLSDFVDTLSDVLTVARLALFKAANIRKTTSEHIGIAEAIRADDVDKASGLLSHHIQRVRNNAIGVHGKAQHEGSGLSDPKEGSTR